MLHYTKNQFSVRVKLHTEHVKGYLQVLCQFWLNQNKQKPP
jgi:hypothetical protein